MGVGPMNLVITNDALYQLSYTSTSRGCGTNSIIPNPAAECKVFFSLFSFYSRSGFPCPSCLQALSQITPPRGTAISVPPHACPAAD